MTRIWDISVSLSPALVTWPGDPPVSLEPVSSLSTGDEANVSALRLSTHAGTHVDPPVHFLDGGAAADDLPLDVLVGPCVVVAPLVEGPSITRADLAASVPAGATRVLLKTTNSQLWAEGGPASFRSDYVALSPEAATWLVERGVALIGVDYLSVEGADAPGHPVHHTLLSAGAVIVEGLDLSLVEPGWYTLACLPLKIAGGDGAPARAVLLRDD